MKTIKDEDFGIKSKEITTPKIRYASRGIITNEQNKIAILHKELKNEYKLIGGGIDKNETKEEAFLRESLEETGFIIEITKYLGTIIEEKSLDNFIQISHVFIGKTLKNTHKTNLTEQEKAEKSKLIWVTLKEALTLLKNAQNNIKPSPYDTNLSIYHTKFIIKRDTEILETYKKLIMQK